MRRHGFGTCPRRHSSPRRSRPNGKQLHTHMEFFAFVSDLGDLQSDPHMIKAIVDAVTIPVMAKVRIGHFVEAQVR